MHNFSYSILVTKYPFSEHLECITYYQCAISHHQFSLRCSHREDSMQTIIVTEHQEGRVTRVLDLHNQELGGVSTFLVGEVYEIS